MATPKTKKGRIEKPQRKAQTKFAAKKALAAKKVDIEKLAWKSVELPDRFEDATGFYGLEEIDDVEIVKYDSGKIEYLVKNNGLVQDEIASTDESEWEGFDDTIMEFQPANSLGKQTEENAHNSEKVPDPKSFDINSHTLPSGDRQNDLTNVSAWSGLGLKPESLSSIAKLGFHTPTDIQKKAIPEILAGHDVLGKAPTGSGKTLAYGIPILEHILSTKRDDEPNKKGEFAPTAFIISPTRELARQLEEHLKALCMPATHHARIATLIGGMSVQKQQRQLATADIVIGTPGRLWDVLNSKTGLFDGLRKIKFLVIDEADRLLSGHFKELLQILQSLDRVVADNGLPNEHGPRQTLVFSATFQQGLQQKLAGKGRTVRDPDSLEYLLERLQFHASNGKPRFIDVNPGGTSQLPQLLKEAMLECGRTDKDLYLYAVLLLQPPGTKTLIFTNSISTVRQLTQLLQALKLPAHALHSQMPQRNRLRTLERFSSGRAPTAVSNSQKGSLEFDPGAAKVNTGPILVATDVAARGLDIPAVHLVLHYHTPRTADAYIHRSGRTARGGEAGTALLLCSPEEVIPVSRLVAKVHAQHQQRAGIRSARLDRTLVGRLRPRVNLATRIAALETDSARASKKDNLLREAAADLGVDFDESDDADSDEDGGQKRKGKRGGSGRSTNQGETHRLRDELRVMLRRRVNIGVSEKYLSAGGLDMGSLLREEAGNFVGQIGGLEID